MMAAASNIRVGDAEREAVAAQLREHYADGRLTLDELNERLDQAFAAKTRADLNAVTRDLPMTPRPAGNSGTNPWQDATAGSSGYSGHSGYHGGAGRDRGRPSAALAPLLALFWSFVILGSLFAFGLGGEKPLAIVFFLAALAFLRRLLGRRRRGFGGPRGRRCGRRW
jgi:Domain of unknown function (DUF1707)